MALSSSLLSAQIKNQVLAANEQFSENIGDNMDWLFDAVAVAVVNHIRTNLVVAGTTTQACSAGGATGTFLSTSVS